MPKKIRFESAVHQFASAGSRLQAQFQTVAPAQADQLAAWLKQLRIEHPAAGMMRLSWSQPTPGEHTLEFNRAKFYVRGDTASHAEQQRARGLVTAEDRVMAKNGQLFDEMLRAAITSARLFDQDAPGRATLVRAHLPEETHRDHERKMAEQAFHDRWAADEAMAVIDVRRRNEACTAPEMRHVCKALGDLRGKALLDVGCGLGEASVYFAGLGARVTATDVSTGMCTATQRLAAAHGLELETHLSAAEDFQLGARRFDIIYTGNTLHHVDIERTLDRLLPHLRHDGVFVSWDPVAYNPLISIYRRIATAVRTADEHPLRLRDIRQIKARFGQVEVRWFWFATLLVFLWMVFVQRLNPNRVRLWKRVIDNADELAWLYRPLERLDALLLECLPFLRPLCWNVVIVGRHPQRDLHTSHV